MTTRRESLVRSAECTAAVAVALVLRCLFVDKCDIGNDECFSLFYAQQSLPDIVRGLSDYDNPPLWEMLLHFWIIPFGIGTLALRMLPVLLNAATVVPIYLTGERFVGRYAGLTAGLMYACSTFSIFLSHDGRVYSLVGLLAAWSLYLFLRLANGQGSKWQWVWLTVVNLMLMYGHYIAFWVVAIEALITLVHVPTRRTLWRGGLVHLGALAVGFAPMMPTLLARFLDSGMHGTWIPRTTSVADLYFMFCRMANNAVPTVLILALVAAAAVVSLLDRRHHPDTLRLTLFWTVPLLVSFGLSFIRGFFLNRYFYFLFPAFYVSLAAYAFLLAEGRRPWLRIALMSVPVVLMAVSVRPDDSHLRWAGWKGDTSAVASRLNELTADGQANVVVVPNWVDKQLVYYLDPNHEAFHHEGRIEQPVFEPYLSQKGWIYDGSPNMPDHERVYLVRDNGWDISYWESALADAGYHRQGEEQFLQMIIYTYERNTP